MVSPAMLWLALAAVLLLLVLVGADTDGLLLIGAVAGLLLTVAAGLAPALPPLLQALLFAALVAGGYGWLRAWSRRQADRALPPAARAELAEVIDSFDANGEGRVRWQGQSWAAVNLEPGRSLPPGSRVTVMGREGTRLQVIPR